MPSINSALVIATLVAASCGASPSATTDASDTSTSTETASSSPTESTGSSGLSMDMGGDGPSSDELEVRFLGVGGYSIRVGGDQVLTAPLYSNPSFVEVNLGEIAALPDVIDQFLETSFVADAKAILVGHAHYDHLLDVPHVWSKTDAATIYGNVTMRHILAGSHVPPERLVALNDPARPLVDMRMCGRVDACTGVAAENAGDWIAVPGANVRVRAFCSSHPAQVLGVIHFGEGCVDADLPAPPLRANEWLEGATQAYLVDFLDPDTNAPVFRIYYQDAPTDAPVGHVHPDVLAEKRVDVAFVNVGTFDAVADHPGEIVAALDPRYLIGGHWENFFQTQDLPLEPIPFLPDPSEFDALARCHAPGRGGHGRDRGGAA